MKLCFGTPITIVCGKNAVGKSRLIQQSIEVAGIQLSTTAPLTPDLADRINEILADMETEYRVQYHEFATNNRAFHYPDKDLSVDAKLASFGENSLVNVLQQICSTQKDQICYLDKPESGQHPAIQAKLGSLLARLIYVNKLVVETHSELIILRLLRLIRTKKMNKEAVDIFVLTNQIHHMKIDDEGEFTEHWPEGFFDQRSEELFG